MFVRASAVSGGVEIGGWWAKSCIIQNIYIPVLLYLNYILVPPELAGVRSLGGQGCLSVPQPF